MPRKVNYHGTEILYPDLNKKRKSEKYNRKNKVSKYGHILTNRAKNKIKNSIAYIFLTNKNKYLKWVTVTLPTSKTITKDGEVFQDHKYYTKKLGRFLQELGRHYNLKRYIWVAEIQSGKRKAMNNYSGRNAIHFHMVLDIQERVDINLMQSLWCNQIDEFHERSNNCIDIEVIRDDKKLGVYLTKYITKSEKNQIFARIWSQSKNLVKPSNGMTFHDVTNEEVYNADFAYPEDNFKVIDIGNDDTDFKLTIAYRTLKLAEVKQQIKKHKKDNG